MTNRLLLSGFEAALIVIVGIIVLIFIYLMLGKVFIELKEKIMNAKSKKVVQKAYEDSGEQAVVEEPKPEKKQNKYDEILEKVHQNREQYFKEVDTIAESRSGESSKPASQSKEVEEQEFFPKNFSSDDFDVLEKIDFSDAEDFDFGEAAAFANNNAGQNNIDFDSNFSFDENFENQQSFAEQFKRKRMIKRNQTISGEISSCSNRIKAIIALDILNKTKF